MTGYIKITHGQLQQLLDKVQSNIITIRKQNRIKGLKKFVKHYNTRWLHRLFRMKLWLITEEDFKLAEKILNTYIKSDTSMSYFYMDFMTGFNIYGKIQEKIDKLNRVLKFNIKFQELFLDIEVLSDLHSIMEVDIAVE